MVVYDLEIVIQEDFLASTKRTVFWYYIEEVLFLSLQPQRDLWDQLYKETFATITNKRQY